MRCGTYQRQTAETNIRLKWNIDGSGEVELDTGIPFLEHMLTLMSRHGYFDLMVKAEGDLEVDCHHLVEDLGISMGEAFNSALGERKGLRRYGWVLLPMDECLAQVAVDLSGRSFLNYDFPLPGKMLGQFDPDLIKEFLKGFVDHSKLTLHARLLSGGNSHHALEALFKGLGRALDHATKLEEREQGVPSTKGSL